MAARILLPVPLGHKRVRARRRALLIALVAALGSALTPVALVLLPLLAARAWRARGRLVAIAALIAGVAGGVRWVDVEALAMYPALLAGPWIALLIGAVAASTAWATSGRRRPRAMMHAAAALAFLAAPWSPCLGLLLALGLCLAAPARRVASAANDNHPGARPPPLIYEAPRFNYPAPRSARPSACD